MSLSRSSTVCVAIGDETMSTSKAAKVIGVSVPTLDKWIEQRIVPVDRAASGRPRAFRATPRSTLP